MAKAKPVSVSMEKALQAAAKKLAFMAPSLAVESKAYEAWIAFDTAAGLQKAGAIVTARTHEDLPATTFRVRGSPGNMPFISSTDPNAPCHFRVEWEHKVVELHISLNHEPMLRSNRHELDVSLVPHNFANFARHDSKEPPYRGPRLAAVEAKAYRADKALNKNVARALLGLALDLDPGAVAPVVEFRTRSGEVLVHGTFEAPQYFLLTTAKLRPSTEQLLATYGIISGASVLPKTTDSKTAIDAIIDAVKRRLKAV